MDQIPELLEFANSTGDTQRKSELLKALGAKVIMYPNGQYKHLTWTLFGHNLAGLNASDSRLSFI